MVIKIAVIGAGIIGLTSACRILELIPNVKITVFADNFSPNTTSDVSAGYWEPYCISADQADQIIKWGKETYDLMLKKALSKDGNKYGIQPLTAYVLQDSDETKIPYWSNIVHQFKKLTKDDIFSVVTDTNTHLKSGYSFLSTTVVVSKYLSELTFHLRSLDVNFVKVKLNNLKEFLDNQGKEFDYIVNCTGIHARNFVPDNKVYPVKGQVLRVKAPWIKNAVMLETSECTYILPLSDTVVLGGTQEPNNYDLTQDEKVFENIVNRCCKYLPSLKDAEIVSKHAGLRPSREGGVRLEMEVLNGKKVVHNYGHGGSGVTISWGCATNAAHLIAKDMNLIKSKL